MTERAYDVCYDVRIICLRNDVVTGIAAAFMPLSESAVLEQRVVDGRLVALHAFGAEPFMKQLATGPTGYVSLGFKIPRARQRLRKTIEIK